MGLLKNLILAVCAATIGSALTYLVVVKGNDDREEPKTPVAQTDSPEKQPLTRSIPHERDEPPRDRPAPDNQPGQGRSPPGPDDADTKSTTIGIESRRRLQERQNTIERFIALRAKAADTDSRELSARIERRFRQETLDQQWAAEKEKNILAMFEENEKLRSISPLYVTCKSANCQIALSAAGDEQVDALSTTFFNAATESDIGMNNKFVSSFPDPSTGRLVFYISNNGNMDLFE